MTVPEGWERQPLGNLGTFIKGKGGPKSDCMDTGFPCVRYGELYTTHLQFIRQFCSYIHPEKANHYTRLLGGDVLFAGSGETHKEIGTAAVYLGSEEAYSGGDVIIFRPCSGLSPAYLGYAVNSIDANKQKARLGQGSSVIHLYTDHIKQLRIHVPPLPEQKKIAEILSSVDEAIQATRETIEQTKRVKKGLLQELLTRGIGHTRFKQTEIGEIPEEWEVVSLGECCNIKNTKRKPINATERVKMHGSYPYYGPTGIIDYIDEYRLEGQYVLIGEDGDHFLKYRDWPMTQLVSGRFNVNNHAHILKGTERCRSEWIYHYFRHRDIYPFLTRQGAGRYKLNKASLVSLPIALPSPEEQLRLAIHIDAVELPIQRASILVEELSSIKRGLMQDLLTGKVRV